MPAALSQSSAHSCPRSPSYAVTPSQCHGSPKQSGTVGSPEVELDPPTTSCYVFTARGGDICERRPISTAGELQAEIADLVDGGTQAAALSPAAFTAAREKQTESLKGVPRPLIAIHGLPGAFVSVLLDSPLDIDPAFVEAQAAGASYRPLGPRRRRGARAARYAHWDYPELVDGHWQAVADKQSCPGVKDHSDTTKPPDSDLARQPVARPVPDAQKALSVSFCRASLWVSQDVDVLFLEQRCWGANGTLRKARRGGKVTENNVTVSRELRPNSGETKGGSTAVARGGGQEIPSLDSILQESLATTYKDIGAFQALEETAYEQWLELFAVLTPRHAVARSGEAPLEWQILQCLERNIDMAKGLARHRNGSGNTDNLLVSPDDWEGLIQRLRTRVEILAAFSPRAMHEKPSKSFQEQMAYIPRRRRPEADTPSSQGSDANQRSLDRVTYLGGILLPFSIVSGVLSMNESFEPGQPLFWVFWVATIPLTLFTVLVIYADKLRQVEVWSEVLDPGGSVSEDGHDKMSAKSDGGGEMQETEKEKRNTTPAFGISQYDMDHQPETVTYSAGDVVIDLGTPTADTQHISADPPLQYREDRRRNSVQDHEEASSDEDTAGGAVLPMTTGEAGYRPGWKKKQLGWKGAAMCILRIQKPLWVLDGMPAAERGEQRGG